MKSEAFRRNEAVIPDECLVEFVTDLRATVPVP